MTVHNGNIINVAGCGGAITIAPADYVETGPPYEGIQIQRTFPRALLNASNARPHIVYVSGTGGNPWGHALFWIDPSVGMVHAALPGQQKLCYIPPAQWDTYVQQNQKLVWQFVPVYNWNPNAASFYLWDCLKNGFNWHPGNDCATFCHKLARAGGAMNTGSTSVMPSKAVRKNLERGNIVY
jgi:hypothetical protein